MTLSKLALPQDYGYVVLVGAASIFVNAWHGINVSKARKKYEVPYPIMYSSANGGDNQFNCVQRAHQNYIEGWTQFMFLLCFGGLQYPRISAGMGLVYLAGRILYAKGYYSGDPEKRKRGAFLHAAELVMLGNVLSLVWHMFDLPGSKH